MTSKAIHINKFDQKLEDRQDDIYTKSAESNVAASLPAPNHSFCGASNSKPLCRRSTMDLGKA